MLPPELVTGGGRMGELIREHPWEETDVGPVDKWPPSLLNTVSIMLSSRFPMILFWGKKLEIFGARHPVLGKPGIEVWAEVWNVLEPMFQQVLAGGATWSEDQLMILTRNHYVEETYLTWSYSPVRLEDGTVGGVFTPINETTKRVLGERRLRTVREFGVSASQLEDVESACRVSTDIFEANNADIPFSVLYLLEQNKLVLKSTSGLPQGHAAAPLEISLNVEDQRVWPAHSVMTSGDSVVVTGLEAKLGHLPGGLWTESSQSAVAFPILGTDRKIVGMLVLGVNVRRALDDDYKGYFELVTGQVAKAIASATALQEEKKRAEMLIELDRSKTIFFSNVSHEFRTPLTLIMGPLEDSLADTLSPLSAAHRERLTIVQRNGMRLLRLVNSILDFSRIEAGRMQAKFEVVDLPAFTEDLASVFRAAFEKAGIDLVVTTTPLEQDVYVDTDMWEKVVYNLMSNAIKYTVSGSVHVSLASRDDSVVLSVSDTGVGISEEELPKVFERFHRVENSEGRSHEGTGIGLSLTRELAKLHGGKMTLDSKLGIGSTFSVVIPYGTAHLPPQQIKSTRKRSVEISQLGQAFVEEALRWMPCAAAEEQLEDATTEKQSVVSIDTPPQSKGKILLADDNSDMREYVCSLLERKWECVTVGDGMEALTMLQNNPGYFDVILSDIMMPRMNGFELLAAVKADESMQYLPVILLSARAGDEAAVEGLQAGADDYLIKPFASKELLARVATHLELSQFRRELERVVQERTATLAQVNVELQETLKERQQAEHALRISEQHYRTLAKASPVGIIHTDAQGRAFYINDRWSEISGHDKNEGMGHGWLDLAHHEDLESVAQALRDAISGNPLKLEFRYENKMTDPPSIRWVLGQDLPDIDENGVVQGFVCTLTDVTERKKLEKERYDACAQAEMEQRNRAEDAEENKRKQAQFVDMICHEIRILVDVTRNPLNGILNNIDIMRFNSDKVNPLILAIKDGVPKGEEIYDKVMLDMECLSMIEQCARQQLVITDDVIRASKLEANKVVLHPINFAPYTLIDNIVNLYSSELTSKQIVVDLRIDIPKTLVLHSDPDRISQVLMNLLANAIKFIDKSSVRQISIQSRVITIVGDPQSHVIETTVMDTGLGMTDEEQALIFQRFAQAKTNTFHEYGGNGLGLYISKMLVDLLGGEITVSSKKSQGTTFKFTIKCRSEVVVKSPVVEEQKETEEAPQSTTANPQRRILIVEDNLVNQKVLLRQLTMAGYLCDVASNGQEAVESHETGGYDLIFMDVEMPIMNGFEATKEIRRRERERGDEASSNVVIIGLSGNAREVFSEMGESVGMNDYVVKPYKREDLQRKIKDYIPGA